MVANLPTFMRRANRYVPPWVQTQVLSLALNGFFQSELAKGEPDFMGDKTLDRSLDWLVAQQQDLSAGLA